MDNNIKKLANKYYTIQKAIYGESNKKNISQANKLKKLLTIK